MSRDDATLLDMLRAAELVVSFRGEMAKPEFQSDLKTQSAILHQLLVLGEAAKRASAEFRAASSDIPWKAISGMRDRLIRGYDDVDLDEVWKTATSDIPKLIPRLRAAAPPEQAG